MRVILATVERFSYQRYSCSQTLKVIWRACIVKIDVGPLKVFSEDKNYGYFERAGKFNSCFGIVISLFYHFYFSIEVQLQFFIAGSYC